MKIRQAGRPKIINREAVINIALTQYWEHGIENVSLTNIANLLKISRPTIYNEFSNEDNLIAEVIQKYINISAEPSDLNYDNFKQYPNHLFTHFKSNIYDNNKYLINNYTHHGIKRPEKAIGCLLQKSILNKYNFKSKSFNIINKYNIKRQKRLIKYIKSAQTAEVFINDIDPIFYSKYLQALFCLIQTLKLQRIKIPTIKNIINEALNKILINKNILWNNTL